MLRPNDASPHVVVVDDDREMRQSLLQFLSRSGIRAIAFARAEDALRRLESDRTDVVVSDVRMPGMSGLDLLGVLASFRFPPQVLLITAHGDVPMAVEAMKAGAFDFVEKPFQPSRLLDSIRRAVSYGRLKRENAALRDSLERLSGLDSILIGESPDMRRLREDIADIALSDAPVLILGETGTGKELVARALHRLGPRSGGPFVPVNCATIPLQDFETGTGCVPEAFSGAESGTLFLDELGVCPPEVQARLLRVIEWNGNDVAQDTGTRNPDFRILSASNRQLDTEVDAGDFRRDLYYRLNTVIIRIPPLRDRGDDIARLYSHFVGHYAELYGIDVPEPTIDDIAALMSHDWLGNVRELRHVAERRILAWRRGRGSATEAIAGDGFIDEAPPTLREAVAFFERQLVAKAIQSHEGRMDAAAEALGIGRRTLNEKIVKLGIDKNDLL
ncbi:MAG: sigma-54 dependent transcriptional regulator [Paracoccaceae bacterium]|nr:sigma-54 dependent transcriptional regulator [Paracoccaceae bacterium]MDE2915342.1 sigma-54 dependent transcriptional regulator [Paracoccaceae bacterium]